MSLSQTELRGDARYLGMAGAFGALGGNLSTLANNPAGIGVYRSSEIGATLDIDGQRTTLNMGVSPVTATQTRVACNNFGYVGSMSIGSETMPYFCWGVTYNRINSFDRSYRAYNQPISSSLTNYVAAFTDGFDLQTSAPDLSVLAYNTFLINPWGYGNTYSGLMDSSSSGTATVDVIERGYTDQYNINFGGNVMNTVYWGLGFGITDISRNVSAIYQEYIDNPVVPSGDNRSQLERGDYSEYTLENYERVKGTGFNMNFGLIVKPTNEFRLGFAVQTPTWYNLDYITNAWCTYDISDNYFGNPDNDSYATMGEAVWSSKIRTPWRIIASAAGVLDGRYILSADYEYKDYTSMTVSDDWGKDTYIEADVKQYYQAQHILRLGAEYRVTPKFSLRLGYSYASSPVKSDARDGYNYIYQTNSSTNPMYTMENNTQNITAGLGYRTGSFYIDLAYVHTIRSYNWQAFTNYPANSAGYSLAASATTAPNGKLTDIHNRFALSLGFRF